MNISKKVEQLRKEHGWSVARLARETDIPTVSLRVMLKRDGGNNWNTVPLKKIADKFGVSVSYLTSDDDDYTTKPRLTREQYAQLQQRMNDVLLELFDVDEPRENESI